MFVNVLIIIIVSEALFTSREDQDNSCFIKVYFVLNLVDYIIYYTVICY